VLRARSVRGRRVAARKGEEVSLKGNRNSVRHAVMR
jgi:hypothetical protein